MSVRQPTADVRIGDRENLTRRPGKLLSKPIVTKRAALVDLGTNLGNKPIDNVKKPESRDVGAKKQFTTKVPVKKTIAVPTATSITDAPATLKQDNTIVAKLGLHESRENKTLPRNISYSTKQLMTIIDADANDKDDPFLVAEYVQDIFKYLREVELMFPIKKNYLSGHSSTTRMRSVLVSWMVDVHINFKLLQETLHLSIALLDRYLQHKVSVGRETLQLVGVTAMLIASKYEEMYMPEINDFVYICDNSCTATEIKKMEIKMLSTLKFNLGRPLSLHFLRRYNKVATVSPDHHNLAKYLLEIFLLHHELCHINPSLQAAAAACLALSILSDVSDPSGVWTKTLVHYSLYKYADIKPVIINLAHFLYKMDKCKFQSIREKYSTPTYGKISLNSKLQGPLVKKLHDQSLQKN